VIGNLPNLRLLQIKEDYRTNQVRRAELDGGPLAQSRGGRGQDRSVQFCRFAVVDRTGRIHSRRLSDVARTRKVTLADSNDRIEAEGLQVINGAQTVKALVRAAEGHSLDPEPSILVRITEISKGYAAEGVFYHRHN
jgi:AIPR protein